jgi:hypothetical protein
MVVALGLIIINIAAVFGFLALEMLNISGNGIEWVVRLPSYFLGGLVMGFVARKNAIILGTFASLGSLLLLIASLAYTAYTVSDLFFFPPLMNLQHEIIAAIFGPFGSYLGERLRKA